MKLFNKHDLKFVNNYIVTEDGDIVSIDTAVFAQAAELDLMVQKADWLHGQPKACAGPDLSKFKREGRHSAKIDVNVQGGTPALDEAVKKAKAIMDDIDKIDKAERRGEMAEKLKRLLEWCDNDYVAGLVGDVPQDWDFPFIENPLELTVEDVFDLINVVCTVEEED